MEIKEKEAKGGGGSFGGFGGFGNTDTAKDKVAILSIYWLLLWFKKKRSYKEMNSTCSLNMYFCFFIKGGSPTPKPSTIMSESKGGEGEELIEFDTSPLEMEMKEAMEIK